MGGRDHSYECETCGLYRGGINDLPCDCDDPHAAFLIAVMQVEAECRERLDCLAQNLAIGAALCRADLNGCARGMRIGLISSADQWRPGCRRSAP